METMARLGALLAGISIASDKQTQRIVSLTRGLFRLTVALVVLTFALLVLTGYLTYDSYLNRHSDKSEQSHRAKPDQAEPVIHPTRLSF